ncbi:histone deacetylase 6 isoform X4 [Heterodontus francisci]|uniref:histone deacetylase 6 isoform X4 n=1 Tax=Heterodontus francisci TaxID=7792 RepID=UPI00355BC592
MAEVMRPLPTHKTGLLYDERMQEHYNMWDFQHPEQPKRISRIFARHQELNLVERCQLIPAQHATESQLEMCHGEKYIEILKSTMAMKPKELHRQSCEYNSIFIAPQSYESALLAVGSTFSVVEAVLNDKVQNGVAIVRPPGHHAEKDKACGFCFFNNVALAARFAQNTAGRKMKVLILDWDVHHGNGTQHMFESDPSVLYISLHRYDQSSFFPNSEDGNYDKVGIDAGEGFNVNIAWNGNRMGDSEYMAAFHRVVMPICYQFQPELVLVSAGFDAARGDPLGGCLVSPECYAHMTHMLLGLAGGRVVLVLEGGYNLTAISESMAMCTRTLLGDTPPYLEQLKLLVPSAALAISNVIATHRKYWSCLRLLAAELDLQIQPMMTRTWGQQPVSSQAAVPLVEPRVQASQSRRTSMWLQQQAPSQVPQLDASGQPMLITQMPLWPRPPPSPLAILPLKQEEEPDDPTSVKPPTDSQVPSSWRRTPMPKGKAGLKQGPSALTNERSSEGTGLREKHSSLDMISISSSISKLPGSSEDELPSLSSDKASRWCPETKGPLPVLSSSSRTLSAITPMKWCPHLDLLQPLPKSALDVNQPCQECGSEGENWVCLTCFQVYCGRYVNEHMLVHGLKHKHLLVLSYVDLSAWCYGCDSYVHNEMLLPVKEEVHRLKFGEELA